MCWSQITLTGLILVGCSHLLFAIYCPLLDGDAPAWLFVVAALALFGYQVELMPACLASCHLVNRSCC